MILRQELRSFGPFTRTPSPARAVMTSADAEKALVAMPRARSKGVVNNIAGLGHQYLSVVVVAKSR